MERVGKVLRDLRKKKRLSQDELGAAAGVNGQTISNIETGKVEPRGDTYRAIAAALGLTVEQLDAEFDANTDPYSEMPTPEIPLFDLHLAAGNWTDVTDLGEATSNAQIDHGRFRVRLRGNSMEPTYKDGTVVEFRCLRADHEGPLAGRDYYVQRSDGMATFKRMERVGEDTLTLRALNRKKYPKPMPVARADVVRMAVASAKVELLE